MGLVAETREKMEQFVAPNYAPLPFVPLSAKGEWVDAAVEGEDGQDTRQKLLNLHGAYSAEIFGANYSPLKKFKINRMIEDKPALSSRGLGYNQELAELGEKLSEICGTEMMLPKNVGVEPFDTLVKTAVLWAQKIKGIEHPEIIVCGDKQYSNFHGRTVAATAASTDPDVCEGFEPLTKPLSALFKKVRFGDIEALKNAITRNTALFLTEPILAEAGVIIPPFGYLSAAGRLCKENRILFMLDEVQTGWGRTGTMFAWQHEGESARPDGMMLGKALGGGMNIISALVLTKEALNLLGPGKEGSTFGGNPEACAVATKTFELISTLGLPERAAMLGDKFLDRLKAIDSPLIKECRGRGLLVAMELTPEAGGARAVQEALFRARILSIKRHDNTIGFSPPLNIDEYALLDFAPRQIEKALASLQARNS